MSVTSQLVGVQKANAMRRRPLTCDPDNKIELWTRNGPCEIHLLSGDITQHTLELKMDIIMVSAFPGDYAPLRGTVLGALNENLGINTGLLSYDKELDLRHHFSCWLSKPITELNSPFKKLLCFERRRNEMTIAQQISEMFRVFTPVFNNQDHTVITPLLATGHQGSNKGLICRTMVNAAAHWITAGLPLRCLKIVVYEDISEEIKKNFQEMKEKYLKGNKKLKERIFTKKYDFFIFSNPSDKFYVDSILQTLKKTKTDVKIYFEKAKFDKEKVWQYHIFKSMVSSKRIIAVLSDSFLESSECLEQYNMAVCCNRLVGQDILTPFYIENVKSLPTYMGLVQWIDCRVRKEGETSELKIKQACAEVLLSLDTKEGASSQTGEVTKADAKGDKFQYDVFISYSHKNPAQAKTLLETFKTLNKDVKVFYDRSSLTTGSNWQNMLYRCLGQCHCVICLMSPDFFTSTVCMEEYSLALARYLSRHEGMTFIPISVEKLDTIPAYLSQVEIMDVSSTNFGITFTRIAEMVCRWLEKKSHTDEQEDSTRVEQVFSELRTKDLERQYTVKKNGKERTFTRRKPLVLDKPQNQDGNKPECDIAVIYANDSMHLAGTFCAILDKQYPGLDISVRTQQGDHRRLEHLDKAKHVVIFVSQEFLATDQQMQELHLSLCRQRQSEDRVLYLIKSTRLEGQPFFPRIFPFDISCTDPIWNKFEKDYFDHKESANKITRTDVERLQHATSFVCSYAEFFAVTKAAEDILEFLTKPSGRRPSKAPILTNVLAKDLDLHGKVTIEIPTSLHIMEEQAVQKDVEERKKAEEEEEERKKEEESKSDEELTIDDETINHDIRSDDHVNKDNDHTQDTNTRDLDKGDTNERNGKTSENNHAPIHNSTQERSKTKADSNSSNTQKISASNKSANETTPKKKSSACVII